MFTRMKRRLPVISAILVAVAGLGMVVGSYFLSVLSQSWWSSLLLSSGTAVLLGVPLFLLTRTLDRHIEEANERALEAQLDVQELRGMLSPAGEAIAAIQRLGGTTFTIEQASDPNMAGHIQVVVAHDDPELALRMLEEGRQRGFTVSVSGPLSPDFDVGMDGPAWGPQSPPPSPPDG